MPNTYNIGNSTQEIELTAQINSGNPAVTEAYTMNLADPAANPQLVAASANASGNIINKQIGTRADLSGKRLSVQTTVGITGNTLATRQQAAAQVSGSYILDKGEEGRRDNYVPLKSVNTDSTEVILTLNVDLQ